MELIYVVTALVVGFVVGVLFGRKNKATVERSLVATSSALETVRVELQAAKTQIARLTKKKQPA